MSWRSLWHVLAVEVPTRSGGGAGLRAVVAAALAARIAAWHVSDGLSSSQSRSPAHYVALPSHLAGQRHTIMHAGDYVDSRTLLFCRACCVVCNTQGLLLHVAGVCVCCWFQHTRLPPSALPLSLGQGDCVVGAGVLPPMCSLPCCCCCCSVALA